MLLTLMPDLSRIYAYVSSEGLMKNLGIAHDRTIIGRLPAITIDTGSDPAFEVPVELVIDSTALAADAGDLNRLERREFNRNLHGRQVLDSRRHPTIQFSGRFAGTLDGGQLDGEIDFRGRQVPFACPIRCSVTADRLNAGGEVQQSLSAFGLRPFTALLGALRLRESFVIGLELVFARD